MACLPGIGEGGAEDRKLRLLIIIVLIIRILFNDNNNLLLHLLLRLRFRLRRGRVPILICLTNVIFDRALNTLRRRWGLLLQIKVSILIKVGVPVGVSISIKVGVPVGASISIKVGVSVRVSISIKVGVSVGVSISIEVGTSVGVSISIGVRVFVQGTLIAIIYRDLVAADWCVTQRNGAGRATVIPWWREWCSPAGSCGPTA